MKKTKLAVLIEINMDSVSASLGIGLFAILGYWFITYI